MGPKPNHRPEVLSEDYVVLGKVGKPLGLKGWFYLQGRNDLIPREFADLFVKRNPKDRWRPLKILDCRWHKDEVVVFTDLGPTRTDIELWRGAEVGIPAHRLVSKPEEGVVYWDDLKGRRIETADGVYLGTIEYIYCAGASDVMSLEGVEPLDIPLVDDFIDLKKIPSDRHQTVALKVTQDFIRPLLRDAPNAQSDHSPESFP